MNTQLETYKNYLQNIKKSLVYYNYLCPFFEYLEKNNLDFLTITKDQIAVYFNTKIIKLIV